MGLTVIVGLDNDLAQSRRRTINWNYDNPEHRRIHICIISVNELMGLNIMILRDRDNTVFLISL